MPKNVNKIIKWSFSWLWVRVSKGRERVHQLPGVFVPHPIGFCILKRQASRSCCFIFLLLIPHYLQKLPGKLQLPFFSSFTAVLLKPKADVNGASATSRKIQKLVQQTFREEYWTDIHVLWSLHLGYNIIWWCNVCCFDSQSFMFACMMSWVYVLFIYQNMCIMLKIRWLHWKLDFVSLSHWRVGSSGLRCNQ